MMRITTNSMLFNYQYNRMNSTNLMNNAMTKVMTQRQFSYLCYQSCCGYAGI